MAFADDILIYLHDPTNQEARNSIAINLINICKKSYHLKSSNPLVSADELLPLAINEIEVLISNFELPSNARAIISQYFYRRHDEDVLLENIGIPALDIVIGLRIFEQSVKDFTKNQFTFEKIFFTFAICKDYLNFHSKSQFANCKDDKDIEYLKLAFLNLTKEFNKKYKNFDEDEDLAWHYEIPDNDILKQLCIVCINYITSHCHAPYAHLARLATQVRLHITDFLINEKILSKLFQEDEVDRLIELIKKYQIDYNIINPEDNLILERTLQILDKCKNIVSTVSFSYNDFIECTLSLDNTLCLLKKNICNENYIGQIDLIYKPLMIYFPIIHEILQRMLDSTHPLHANVQFIKETQGKFNTLIHRLDNYGLLFSNQRNLIFAQSSSLFNDPDTTIKIFDEIEKFIKKQCENLKGESNSNRSVYRLIPMASKRCQILKEDIKCLIKNTLLQLKEHNKKLTGSRINSLPLINRKAILSLQLEQILSHLLSPVDLPSFNHPPNQNFAHFLQDYIVRQFRLNEFKAEPSEVLGPIGQQLINQISHLEQQSLNDNKYYQVPYFSGKSCSQR